MLKNSLKKISFCREEIKVKAKVLFKIINNKYLKIKINQKLNNKMIPIRKFLITHTFNLKINKNNKMNHQF